VLLTLLGKGQGAAAAGINVADVIQRLLPSLGAYKLADVVFWTEEELYEYADEGIQRLAKATGLFVERDASTTLVAGTALYNLPTRHLSTIHVSLLGGANLRGVSVRDLEALDATWEAATGVVEKFAQDFRGTEQLRLYRNPSTGGTLAVVFHQYPAEIAQATPTLTGPVVLEDYLSWAMLSAARGKEGDAAMPEVAKHAEERIALFEQVFKSYWGQAQ